MNPLLPNRIHTVATSGLTYAYIHHTPTQQHKPTLLFIHGFPATSHDWHHQIRHFRASGYGILAPDCLGYGGSSKPTAIEAYVGKAMAEDILSILDSEGLQKVIGIAHDWGTYLLSQLVIWHPARFEKIVFFSVPFNPPGRGLDVRAINEATKKKSGFEQFGYQVFLASESAGKILGQNWEKFFHSVFPADPTYWKTHFAPTGALRAQLEESGNLITLAPYISALDKAHHHAAFGDDYSAPCKWYTRGIANLGVEEEKKALDEGRIGTTLERFKGEVLMVGGLKDVVCPANHARSSMGRFVPGGEESGRLIVRDVDAGHWIMLEKVEETNRILSEFFEGHGGSVKASL